MKTNRNRCRPRVQGASTLITLGAIILLGCSENSLAQQTWNTNGTNISNANTGNVGVGTGTTSPDSILTVQTTGPDNAGEKYLRVRNTSSFTGVLLEPGQSGDTKWLLLGGYPNAGDFTV